MSTFVEVVDQGSFAGAARQLNVDQAVVTRQVAWLEKHLGVKLLERTTRSMRLTEAGETYLRRCRDILNDVDEAEATVGQVHHALAGHVRLAVPTLFGRIGMVPLLVEIKARFPDLTLDLAMLDRQVDPVAEGFDVVLADEAWGVPSTAIARSLLSVPYLLCAAPAYLARHGAPREPAELSTHAVVAQWQVGEHMLADDAWHLRHDDGRELCVPVRPVLRANHYALTYDAVLLGMGIGRFTPRMVKDAFAQGTLVPVLPQWRAGTLNYNLIYPSRRLMPRRVRVVIDIILDLFDMSAGPPEAQGDSTVSAQPCI